MEETRKLTEEAIEEIMKDSMFKEEEVPGDSEPPEELVVWGQAITCRFGFHKDRLQAHRQEVIGFLDQLYGKFDHPEPVANLIFTGETDKWTQEGKYVESLAALGNAFGIIEYPYPPFLAMMLGPDFPIIRTDRVPKTEDNSDCPGRANGCTEPTCPEGECPIRYN